MEIFTAEHEGIIYVIQDMGEYFKVSFPDESSLKLYPHLDDTQEIAFMFEGDVFPELAEGLTEQIIRKTQ